jgi:hypothetical protein
MRKLRSHFRLGLASRFCKRDVARIHVHDKDPIRFKDAQDSLRFGPAIAELLDFFRTLIGHDFLGEVRCMIEVGAAEIKDEWALYDRHLKNHEVVVVVDQLRHMKTVDLFDVVFLKPKINVTFPKIFHFAPMSLHCTSRGSPTLFGLAFHHEHDTINTEAKFLADHQSVVLGVFVGSAQRFITKTHEQ